MVESHDQPAECGESLAWRLDWNLLRSFLVIVEERSFTTAAQRLNLKQPTVSNALRRLEETLGRRLINRGPREFEITPHGEALFRQAFDNPEITQDNVTAAIAEFVNSIGSLNSRFDTSVSGGDAVFKLVVSQHHEFI